MSEEYVKVKLNPNQTAKLQELVPGPKQEYPKEFSSAIKVPDADLVKGNGVKIVAELCDAMINWLCKEYAIRDKFKVTIIYETGRESPQSNTVIGLKVEQIKEDL